MDNIYRKAYEIVVGKAQEGMTKKERKLVGAAIMLVTYELTRVLPQYDNLPISEGLLMLAELTEKNSFNIV